MRKLELRLGNPLGTLPNAQLINFTAQIHMVRTQTSRTMMLLYQAKSPMRYHTCTDKTQCSH